MDCKEAKDRLISLLTGELSKREKKRLLNHLAACGACSEEEKQLETVWQVIGALPEMEVPGDLRDATLTRIEEMLQAEEPDRLWVKIGWQHWAPKPLAAVFGGVAMVFFSLWVLRGVTVFAQLSDELIFLCAALWTGILAGAFLLATDSVPAISSRWRWASRVGLLSLGFTMAGTLLCPKMNLIHWWETLPPGQFLLSFGPAVSHGAFGIIYSFLPFSIALY
ncbi:MAG: zf-HC2 domain-containing protein, partial [Deltaproteobacteria bacterium]|nr:zf-HC2 domain-containing protein [Deltaproteobacteria bacterium]